MNICKRWFILGPLLMLLIVNIITISGCENDESQVDTLKNGLVYEEELQQWRYYEQGNWISDKWGLVEYNGGQFFVVNGVIEASISGLQLIGDNFYYLAYGQVQTYYTGLAYYDGEWFYVENGVLAINFNGIQDYDGGKFLVAAGRVLYSYSGLYLAEDENWYFISGGQVQTYYTGHVQYDGTWFYLRNGVLDVTYQATGLEGKTFSILGDSISSYTDLSSGAAAETTNSTIGANEVYYTTGFLNVYENDTWWMQAVNQLGLRLLVNNSWSGSCIRDTHAGTVGAYVDRCVQLHDDTGENAGDEPDIIAVYLGTNDCVNYQGTLGDAASIDYDSLITQTAEGYVYKEPATTAEAYAIMMHKLTERYPNAEVYCFTLLPYPYIPEKTHALLQGFNNTIGVIAEHFGAHVVDLYHDSGITNEQPNFDYYMENDLHPGLNGMDAITDCFVEEVLENSKYIN